jgi:mRNA-degrading endonuclease RelE of RelBE toxin-antitoxin system
MHQIIYTAHARQDLKKLQQKTAQRIIKKIHHFSLQKNPLSFATHLTNSKLSQYRFRIGDYRVLFDADQRGNIYILYILKVKHRKDVYDL